MFVTKFVDTYEDEIDHPKNDRSEYQTTCYKNEKPGEDIPVRPERKDDKNRHDEDGDE